MSKNCIPKITQGSNQAEFDEIPLEVSSQALAKVFMLDFKFRRINSWGLKREVILTSRWNYPGW